ncbi:hypothetical protein ACMG4P_05080 [Pseudovibrio denitrificans]|uniref:hypothetical protein n=1 Tax=Pseudovibrio denitrificans TaxID=258256 RepID=UPI0039BF3F7C
MKHKRITWRQTWPDTPDDGVGKDPENPECSLRVYKTLSPQGRDVWYWFANTIYLAIDKGEAESKEEAKAAAEAAYFNLQSRQQATQENRQTQ